MRFFIARRGNWRGPTCYGETFLICGNDERRIDEPFSNGSFDIFLWFANDARGLTYLYATCPTFILHDARQTRERNETRNIWKEFAVYPQSSNSLRMKYFTYYSWKKKIVFRNTHIQRIFEHASIFFLSLRIENNFNKDFSILELRYFGEEKKKKNNSRRLEIIVKPERVFNSIE